MKVLYVGSTEGAACALHYFTSFVRLGHTVLPYNPRYFDSRNLLEKFSIKIKKKPTRKRIQQAAQDLILLCQQNQFDVVFVMSENFLHGDTIAEMKHVSAKNPQFIYHSHDNNFSNGILKPSDFFETLTKYDMAFTTKSQNVKKYKALGQKNAFFIPSAYEPTVHYPIPKKESRYADKALEVTFVGTYDKSRDPLLDQIGWEHLKVWGSHWQKSPNFSKHREHITNHPIYYFEFADVLTHSACSLGLLRQEAEDLHTQRTFEIPACGSLQFSPRTDEILTFFDEDKEIVCFESPDELKEKLDYYLKHPTQRQKLARAGHKRCLSEGHTYPDRVSQMLNTLRKATR